MRINIKVKTNSGKQGVEKIRSQAVEENALDYKVYLKNNAKNNLANIELIKVLSKYFGKEIRIVKGKTSKKKIVEVKNEI